MISGTLPVIYINTEDQAPIIDKETYITAGLWIEIPEECPDTDFQLASASEPVELQIRGRGNSSWLKDKKPYKIKFTKKTAILGMPKHKHFALLALEGSFTDWLMQATGKELTQLVGLGWVPHYQPVELILNGRYDGLYFMYESVKIGSERLDIFEQPDLNEDPETIPYGWLVEIDNYVDDCQIIVTEGNGYPMKVTYHTPEELSEQQLEWLTDEFTDIAQAPYGENPESWADHIDPVSLVHYFIVRELMTDYDGFNGSVYMYRDMEEDARWKLGPMWDNSFNGWVPDKGWTMDILPEWSRWKLMPGIFNTEIFKNTLRQEWDLFYPHLEELRPMMLALADKCYYADRTNALRWGVPHVISQENAETIYKLIVAKAEWINEHLDFVTGGIEEIAFDAKTVASESFYSIDGTLMPSPPSSGICLQRIVYTDGTSRVVKVCRR